MSFQSAGRSVSDSSFKMPSHVAVVCGVCGTRMTPRSKHAGRKIKCPDCETMCPIPTLEQIKARHREAMLAAPAQPEDHEPYDLQAPAETLEPTHNVFRELSSVRREDVPNDPPRFLFFSTVFEFPWRSRATLGRWSLVAVGFSIVGIMAWGALYMLAAFGFLGAISAGFLLLGVAVIGLISAGSGCAYGYAILQETAAGVDEIEVWPEAGWRDGIFEFMQLLWLHATSGFFCYLFALLVQLLTDSLWPPLLAMHVLLFPLALIMAMDSDSAWLPWSTMALKSLRKLPGQWALFYVLSGLLLAGAGWGYFALAEKASLSAGCLLGPVVASVGFIYARLLGRLVWKIGEAASLEDDVDLDL